MSEHGVDVDVDDPIVEGEGVEVEGLDGAGSSSPRAADRRRNQARTNRWMRWLHTYTSMVSLLVVLFFGLTGVTLNHPTWTFGDAVEHRTVTGTLPDGFSSGGEVDFLAVTEHVRNTDDVKGAVSDYDATASQGTVSFKSPGYAADLVFDVDSGAYTLTIDQQGFVGVMNDLHKGRDADSSWTWVIDLSGGLLVLVAATGLGIQVFQRKRRRRSLLLAGAGGAALLVLMYVALG